MQSDEVKLTLDKNTDYLDELPLILTSMELFIPEGDSLSSPSTHKYYELTYVVEGELNYVLDGKVYPLKQGSTIIVWPEAEHSYEVLSKCEVACVYFSLNYQIKDDKIKYTNNNKLQNSEIYKLLASSPKTKDGKDTNCIVIRGKGQEEIAAVVETIISENAEDNFAKVTMLQALALELLVQVSRSINSQAKEQKIVSEGSADDLVDIACAFIEDNYKLDLNASSIADHVYLSTGYLTRVFQEKLGLTPMEYLNKYRVSKSEDLLLETDLKISNIAELTGFTTTQRFNFNFKKINDCTPSDFRKGKVNLKN